MVVFDFLPENFEGWWALTNGTLPFSECRLSGEDTQRWLGHSNPTCCNQIRLNLLHLEVVGMAKHLVCTHLHPNEPHGEAFTTNIILF